jgi:hypothetical protein
MYHTGRRPAASTRVAGPDENGLTVCKGSIHGMFTARADPAACLLAQLTGERHVRQVAGVITTVGTPSLVRQIWREGTRKQKKS